jgi:capsular polysaccharide transport system permease protein
MSELSDETDTAPVAAPEVAMTETFKERQPQQRRRSLLVLSFVICVLLPSLFGAVYFSFIASDRYVASAGFAVRSMDSGGSFDVVGVFTGLASSGSTTSDSYIVLEYLESRDLLDRLQQDFDFRGIYSNEQIDTLSRLDPALDIENVVGYWRDRIRTSFDPSSGIITFEVEAFSAADAERVAQLVLGYTQSLINHLSEKARKDSVRFAESEVERAEARLREALQELRKFREQNRSIDPAASAKVQIELIGELEKQLLEIEARISALSKTVDRSAPSMKVLRRQAEALKRQIREKRGGVSGSSSSDSALSSLLAAYEGLEVEKEFAQQAYASSLASLENARVQADRQQRYLAIYSRPALPEYPLYPRRLLSTFMLFIVVAAVWGILALITYSVRDHLS